MEDEVKCSNLDEYVRENGIQSLTLEDLDRLVKTSNIGLLFFNKNPWIGTFYIVKAQEKLAKQSEKTSDVMKKWTIAVG